MANSAKSNAKIDNIDLIHQVPPKNGQHFEIIITLITSEIRYESDLF